MIENIKIKPDPQFEKLGRSGWYGFKEKFQEIKRDWEAYGDVVLEKRLGESMDIYKYAFTSDDFMEEIYKIWRERYHYVASNFAELVSFYEMASEKNMYWGDLLPETDQCQERETRVGNYNPFSISKELYDFFVQECKESFGKCTFYLAKECNFYKISIEEERPYTYYSISMKKIDVIKVD